MTIIIFIAGMVIGAIGIYLYLNAKLQDLKINNIKLTEKIKLEQQKSDFLQLAKEQVSKEFRLLSSEILAKDKIDLGNKNKELLAPLEVQIKEFKQRMEQITHEQTKERSNLLAQIKNLQIANLETQQSADNLANALTYDNKQQGDWGEVVLTSILLASGLREGHEFDTQKQYKNQHNEAFKPDVIVHLPDEKDIVIDSKMALKDYNSYIANQDDKSFLKKHIKAIENHINNISIKEYENLIGVKTLDFIFVFIPIEAALWIALENKRTLFDYALKKNIMLVSPSTLTMSLKTISYIWQTDRQNKNTEEIVRQAGAMYDKFVLFTESLQDVEKHLEKASQSHRKAYQRLTSEQGNLFTRAQKLKELGVKSKKELDEH